MTVLCQIAQKIVRPAFKQEETIGLRPNCVSDPANLFCVKIVCVSHQRFQPLNVTYLKQKRKCPFQEIKLQVIDNLVLYRVVRGIPNKDQEDPANLFCVKIVCVSHGRFQPLNVTYLKQKRKCPFQEIKLQVIDNLVLYRVVRGIPNKDQEDPIGTPYTVSLFCIKTHFQLRNDQYMKYM